VPKIIFGPEMKGTRGLRKLHNEDLLDMKAYSSVCIIMAIIPRIKGVKGQVM
jgi:hypothetical protein